MNIESLLDMSGLARAYLFANTPKYLYDNFRANESVARLSHMVSISELIAELRERIGKRERALEDVVVSYAILVALSFADYAEVFSFYQSMSLAGLNWGWDMVRYHESEPRLTRVELPVNSNQAIPNAVLQGATLQSTIPISRSEVRLSL